MSSANTTTTGQATTTAQPATGASGRALNGTGDRTARLRGEIEETRADLASNVAALAAMADPRAIATGVGRRMVASGRQRARQTAVRAGSALRSQPARSAVAATLLVTAVVGSVLLRRHAGRGAPAKSAGSPRSRQASAGSRAGGLLRRS